ncbi:MAG TPA: hypothetical protein VG796_30230 [Verrucomicrobiales bacterium]|nr:hypothetical protein [Verrucomicrobiales bacterium]
MLRNVHSAAAFFDLKSSYRLPGGSESTLYDPMIPAVTHSMQRSTAHVAVKICICDHQCLLS